MKILILGATGLLGNALFRVLSETKEHEVFGTIRKSKSKAYFTDELAHKLIVAEDLIDVSQINNMLLKLTPDTIINCVAVPRAVEPSVVEILRIYSVLPHTLKRICDSNSMRLIQISSDGVFSGRTGNYSEADATDATDIYGISKFLGEITGENAVTLRTSIIGHELKSKTGLLEWFLSQTDSCEAYGKSIFSGFTSIEISKIIRDKVLPNRSLNGVYHLASEPISKYNLLSLIKDRYGSKIKLNRNDTLSVNRSLNADLFNKDASYQPPKWVTQIDQMYSYRFGLRSLL